MSLEEIGRSQIQAEPSRHFSPLASADRYQWTPVIVPITATTGKTKVEVVHSDARSLKLLNVRMPLRIDQPVHPRRRGDRKTHRHQLASGRGQAVLRRVT
jgi:hypothetical protein